MDAVEITRLLQKTDKANRAQLQEQLQQHIAHLIQHDFTQLVQLLYTVDVDEKRLKTLLQQHPQKNAAETIAALLIEPQLQKKAARQQFSTRPPQDDAEKW